MAIQINSLTQGFGRTGSFPDMTQDMSWFIYSNPGVGLANIGEYQQLITFFTNSTTDYTDYYFGLYTMFDGEHNYFVLQDGPFGTDSTRFIAPVNTWHSLGITYNPVNKHFNLFVDGVALSGYVERNFTGHPVTAIQAGFDTSGSGDLKFGQKLGYYRDWTGVRLSAADFVLETASQRAVTNLGQLTCDAPLELITDLYDHIPSNSNDFAQNIAGTTPGTNALPGPFGYAGGIKFAFLPESEQTLFYNNDLTLGAVNDGYTSAYGTGIVGVTLCPNRAGNVWAAYDNQLSGPTFTVLKELSGVDGSELQSITLGILIGERNGNKSLFELTDGSLLTVNRATHALIRLNIPAGTVAHTYANITPNPLDCVLSVDETVIYYVAGNVLGQYNLNTEVVGAPIKDFGFPIIWPSLLEDDSATVYTGTYLGSSADLLRISLDGTLLRTYPIDLSAFSEGLYGYAASSRLGQAQLFGDWDAAGVELPAYLTLNLATGATTGPFSLQNLEGPGLWSSDYDIGSGVVVAFFTGLHSLTVDCLTNNIHLHGAGFSGTPTVTLTLDGISQGFTIVSATATEIIVHPTAFANGIWCAAVDGSSAICSKLTCLYANRPLWELYSFSIKPRPEQRA